MNLIFGVLLISQLFCGINAFIPIKTPIRKNINSLKMINPLPGSDIGIPLNIFQNIYTNLHYGYDISNIKNIGLQFLLGYYTYGNDRYQDALEYGVKKFTTKKEDLYNYILENKEFVKSSLDITFGITLLTLITDENFLINIPFIILLITTDYYKDIKQKFGEFKPLYIATLWTGCTVILPCVLHDHNYSILQYPLDYLPCLLSLFALSNFLDLKDVEEDTENGINTLPVKYGKYNAAMIGLFLLALSSLMFGLNHNYLNRPLINSLNEIQNAGMSTIPYFILRNETKI